MRKSTPPACAVNFAGIDYHKKFSMVTLGDAAGKALLTQRVANDKEAIRNFFKDYPDLVCAVESCRGYEWFVDYLKELGLRVHLSNPYRTKLITQTRCKTDKVDSRILMELLAIGFLPTCYQPTPEERQLRERLRFRAQLVRSATKAKVQILSLLCKENFDIGRFPQGQKGMQDLRNLPLSAPRKKLLEEQLIILDMFDQHVAREDRFCREAVKQNPDASRLTTIPGVGCLTALLLVAELGDVARFKRAEQVAAYVGLVPSVHASADVRRTGRITKQGSSHLRWMLIQSAWLSIRHCPQLRLHFSSVSRRCGRNAAIISVARKLLQIAYRMIRDKTEFTPALVGPR